MAKVLVDGTTRKVLYDPEAKKILVQPEQCDPESACSLPEGACPHALCVTFKATRPTTIIDDEYWDRGYIAELGGFNFTILPYLYYNGEDEPANETDWVAGCYFGGSLSVEVPMTLAEFFDNSHTVSMKISNDDLAAPTTTTVEGTAYGATDSEMRTPVEVGGSLFIGSTQASNSEPILLCGIALMTSNPNNPDEENFIFPFDAFDEDVGTGQSNSGGIVTITGDGSGIPGVGYKKNFDPTYDMKCRVPCPDNEKINATISGVESCGCIDGGGGVYWKFNPDFINFSIDLHRTINDPLGIMQWESGLPIDFVGALERYTGLPDELAGTCGDAWTACRVGEGGCNEVAIACQDACLGDPTCLAACNDAENACLAECETEVNACADCNYSGNEPERRSCACYDLDTTCKCGAHLVVQCVVPAPGFSLRSNILLWVDKGFLCAESSIMDCWVDCTALYNFCMEGCADDPGCELDCFNSAQECQAVCGSAGCSGSSHSEKPVFGWAGSGDDDDLFDVSIDNGESCFGGGAWGHAGTMFLILV